MNRRTFLSLLAALPIGKKVLEAPKKPLPVTHTMSQGLDPDRFEGDVDGYLAGREKIYLLHPEVSPVDLLNERKKRQRELNALHSQRVDSILKKAR